MYAGYSEIVCFRCPPLETRTMGLPVSLNKAHIIEEVMCIALTGLLFSLDAHSDLYMHTTDWRQVSSLMGFQQNWILHILFLCKYKQRETCSYVHVIRMIATFHAESIIFSCN